MICLDRIVLPNPYIYTAGRGYNVVRKLKKVKFFLKRSGFTRNQTPDIRNVNQYDGYLSRKVCNAVLRMVATVTLSIPRILAISAVSSVQSKTCEQFLSVSLSESKR